MSNDSHSYKALVVDDDPVAREMVVHALTGEGFECRTASDGADALQCLILDDHDLVVTDLRMPNKHGHALSVDLLQREKRPTIVVHTSVDDPRLTRDLMTRGIDDIVYKPTNYAAFAAKVKSLVVRRHRETLQLAEPTAETRAHSGSHSDVDDHGASAKNFGQSDDPVPLSDVETKIALVSRILPVSKAALDAFQLTRLPNCSAEKLSAAIERDGSLTAEILALANSSFYNPSGQPLSRIEECVVRIGHQRIGELSLATATLSALTGPRLPWLDQRLVWRQSVAAGIAAEAIVAQGEHGAHGDSSLLIAIMNQLGRVVLGTLYPVRYRHMIQECQQRELPLSDGEKEVFPENHAKIMARLLEIWNIPVEISRPLAHILDSYAELSCVSDPTRTKVEIVKLATLVGHIATGSWHPWDMVEIPPPSLFERLRVHDVGQIIKETRGNYKGILNFRAGSRSDPAPAQEAAEVSRSLVAYQNRSTHLFDIFAELLRNMAIQPVKESGSPGETVLVNSLGSSEGHSDAKEPLFITDRSWPTQFPADSEIVKLPVSFARLRSACWPLTRDSDKATRKPAETVSDTEP